MHLITSYIFYIALSYSLASFILFFMAIKIWLNYKTTIKIQAQNVIDC